MGGILLRFPSLGVIPGAEYDNGSEALLAIAGAAPAKVVIGDTVSVVEEKAPFKPPFVAHARHFSLLSAVSVGVTDRVGKLYLPGIIFGDFCPVCPVIWWVALQDRGKGTPSKMYGLGVVSGRL